ncbi:MAG: DUF4102 domain-containing protein [Alphaproteobacteria bacterium]|nr:DUF4102 domain-containing protein [Alphaproteobacteria bacterium]
MEQTLGHDYLIVCPIAVSYYQFRGACRVVAESDAIGAREDSTAIMSVGRISNRSVAALAPKERPSFLWDDELSGFALKCMPSGHKAYIVQYRRGGRRGTTQRITLGKHGVLTPKEARREARRILGIVAPAAIPRTNGQKNGKEWRLLSCATCTWPKVVRPRRLRHWRRIAGASCATSSRCLGGE